MRRRNYTISRMICTNCGNEGIPIPRKISNAREEGHLKELYCLHCRAYHNHREFRSEWDEIKAKQEEIESEKE